MNEQKLNEVIPPSLAIKAMRDSGYKNTAYALAELIDNSIQANASSVEVLCSEAEKMVNQRTRRRIHEVAVLDNGDGMDADTLELALQFGNGTRLDDRTGIGRFGMGLPNASISQCKRVEIWSWQAGPDNALYTYLDVDEIERGDIRSVPTPKPSPLPETWRSVSNNLSTSGTLVVWSNFEEHRLTWRTAHATLRHTELLAGRMYRKFLANGRADIRLAVLNESKITSEFSAQANDPLYLISPSSTPSPFNTKPMFQPWGEKHEEFPIEYKGETHTVTVRISWARQETVPVDGTDRGRTHYGRHAAKNIGVSIVRADRELDLDPSWALGYDPTERWWGVEVDFPPALDEIFGVTNNKQSATIFSHMANFDWENEAEEGETYMDFRQRLKEEDDPTYFLLDIVQYINQQLGQVRSRLKDQTKGLRSRDQRHNEPSVEDEASTYWKSRSEQGYKTEYDDQEFDDEAQSKLKQDLVENKNYNEQVASRIAANVKQRDRRIIFVESDSDSQAFFNVDPRPGNVTEIVFNSRHPFYKRLLQALDSDVSDASTRELIERIHNASDTLKLLFAAWARYEEEDIPSREKIRDIRHDWGKMAKIFIVEND